MKNVKHISKATNQPSLPAVSEPQWREEWVPLSGVIQHGPLQVRRKLDASAVTAYANMTKEGSTPPPIKTARCAGRLYLLDGWHRMAAGALQLSESLTQGTMVLALVATMPQERMAWEAARANVGHGVRYKASEFRTVFKAWIGAKNHHKGRRVYMSYREMAEAFGMGVSYVTLRKWTMADFPSLAGALRGDEHGNDDAGTYTPEIVTMEEQHASEARKTLEAMRQHAEALEDAENRWDVLQALEVTAAMLRAKGVKPPEF